MKAFITHVRVSGGTPYAAAIKGVATFMALPINELRKLLMHTERSSALSVIRIFLACKRWKSCRNTLFIVMKKA